MHLHEDSFLHRRCVDCPEQAPACNCGIGYQCIVTTRVCDKCGSASCVPEADVSGSTSSGGVSGGAIAGAVIGVLVLLGVSIGLLVWYRRRQRAEITREQPSVDPKPDVPARAEAVLSRPDPVEKPRSSSIYEPDSVRKYSVMSNSTINLDPQAGSATSPERRQSGRGSTHSNPFTDTHSIQTTSASTQSTNVIPIALVPHGSVSSPPHSPASDNRSSSSAGSVPSRPAHSPDLGLRFDPLSSGLNLEHVNVSKDSFRPPNARYAQSQISGVSGMSYRDSVMTSGSFASDVLYEAPQIVTNAGRVNFFRAEVVSVQNSNTAPGTPNTSNSGGQNLMPGVASRVSKISPARSPLAQQSFGPADAISVSGSEIEGQEIEYHPHRNPFGDEHSPRLHSANTTTTFGTPVPIPSTASLNDQYPRQRTDDQETEDSPATARPLSTLTQAASIIGAEIGGATVVRLNSASSANHRLTSARLITPTSGPLRSQDDRVLQQQQAQALAAARARAAASGLPMPSVSSSASSTTSGSSIGGSPNPAFLHARRVSEASTMSAGADSLLESFTFVPPSPIANRPPRSPSSPLATQVVGLGNAMVPPVPPIPRQNEGEMQGGSGKEEVTNRQVQGMSTASTGIEGYDFRIDDGSSTTEIGKGEEQGHTDEEQPREQARASAASAVRAARAAKANASKSKPPPSASANSNLNGDGTMKARQRASLDTLALTADLSAFPLNFDEGRGGFGSSK